MPSGRGRSPARTMRCGSTSRLSWSRPPGPAELPRWDAKESPEARAFGDRWLREQRSAVLSVPSVPARPIGRTLMIDPRHSAAGGIAVSGPFPVPWDERLF